MSGVQFRAGWKIEVIEKSHKRRSFESGQSEVDAWLRSSALQSQKKRLTATKVLLDESNTIVGFYTLATSLVDFSDLPPELTKKLPRRQLPVAVLAWFGIDKAFRGKGLGTRLFATAPRD